MMITQQQQQNHNSASDHTPPLSYNEVSKFFSFPLSEAADKLGVCTSVLKKICHDNGLVRWPYRKFLFGMSIEEIRRDAAKERNKEVAKLSKAAGERSNALANSTVSSSSESQLQSRTACSIQDTTPKSQGVVTMQQQGNKNFQNGRPQNLLCSNLTKGPSPSKDEFKYGFPSEGLLSVASDKWWGSRSPDANDGEEIQEGKQHRRDMVDNDTRVPLVDTEGPESGTIDNPVNLQATASLSVLRKRAAKEGREALMLGISRSHGVKKLGRREKALLLRIFKSSLPDRWMREFH